MYIGIFASDVITANIFLERLEKESEYKVIERENFDDNGKTITFGNGDIVWSYAFSKASRRMRFDIIYYAGDIVLCDVNNRLLPLLPDDNKNNLFNFKQRPNKNTTEIKTIETCLPTFSMGKDNLIDLNLQFELADGAIKKLVYALSKEERHALLYQLAGFITGTSENFMLDLLSENKCLKDHNKRLLTANYQDKCITKQVQSIIDSCAALNVCLAYPDGGARNIADILNEITIKWHNQF